MNTSSHLVMDNSAVSGQAATTAHATAAVAHPFPPVVRSALLTPGAAATGALVFPRVARGPMPQSWPRWSAPPTFLDRASFGGGEVRPANPVTPFVRQPSWSVSAFAELFGSFLLVFGGGSILATASASWVPTGFACLVTALVYALGPLSGAHINPAISFAHAVSSRITWSRFCGYVLLQCIGGAIGGVTCLLMLAGQGVAVQVKPAEPFQWPQVLVAEAFFTGFLCFVHLSVMASCRNHPDGDTNHSFGLAVGLVFISGGCAARDITGGVFFNPSAALGLGLQSLPWPWAYICFELAGAFLGSLLFLACRRGDLQNTELSRSGEVVLGLSCSTEARLWGEFLGTCVMATTVGFCTLLQPSPTGTALPAAAALASLTYSLGDVSGAHFNPAVTVAVALRRSSFSAFDGLGYVVVQILGALVAGLLLANASTVLSNHGQSETSLRLAPPTGLNTRAEHIAVEIFGTTLLTFIFLAVAAPPRSAARQDFHPALTAGGALIAAGCISSALMGSMVLNPAVAVMCDAVAFLEGGTLAPLLPSTAWCSLFELVGSVLAALLHYFCHRVELHKAGVRNDAPGLGGQGGLPAATASKWQLAVAGTAAHRDGLCVTTGAGSSSV